MSTHHERTERIGRDWHHPLAHFLAWVNRPPVRLDAMDRAAHGGRMGS